jgi:hypothetical protein
MAIPGQGRLAIGGAVAAIMVGLLAPGAAAASEQAEADAGPGCRFLDVPVPASVLERQIVELPGLAVLAGAGELPIHGRATRCSPSTGSAMAEAHA